MKSAYETCDELPIKDVPVYGVQWDGIPNKRVNVDISAKDYQLFWQHKERWLWAVIVLCSIYFLMVMFA